MLIPLTLPPPLREFLHDGLRLLVARLAALTEEFRAGLIAAIGRTLADGAENVMERVMPRGSSSRVRSFDYEEDSFDEPETPMDDPRSEIRTHQEFLDTESANNRIPTPLTRAVIAAGLNALGVWLLRVGLVPTSAVVAMLGGMVLMFRHSK